MSAIVQNPPLEPRIGSPGGAKLLTPGALPWIGRLRWAFFAAQAAALGSLLLWVWPPSAGDSRMQALRLSLPLVVSFFSNYLPQSAGRQREGLLLNSRVFALLLVDLLTLSWILALTGGSSNPFTILYLLPVVVGLIALPGSWTTALGLAAVGGYASLFFLGNSTGHDFEASGHLGHIDMHLYGMFFAFAVTSGFICTFVSSLASVLKSREQQLNAMRQKALEQQSISALATLAAGAAHELATPLQTIALAAGELKRLVESSCIGSADENRSIMEDLELICEETGRCRRIIDNLHVREMHKEQRAAITAKEHLFAEVRAALPAKYRHRKLICEANAEKIPGDSESILRIAANLIANAFDASSDDSPVTLDIDCDCRGVTLEVTDSGCGMTKQQAARATEPFYTTKCPGKGMGLGLFIVQSTLHAAGGELSIDSEPERGTRVCARLPLAPHL